MFLFRLLKNVQETFVHTTHWGKCGFSALFWRTMTTGRWMHNMTETHTEAKWRAVFPDHSDWLKAPTDIGASFLLRHPLARCPEHFRVTTGEALECFLQWSALAKCLTKKMLQKLPHSRKRISALFETSQRSYLGDLCCTIHHGNRAGIETRGRIVKIHTSHLMEATEMIVVSCQQLKEPLKVRGIAV